MEQVRKNMADSRGADNPSDSQLALFHSLRKDRERTEKKCMLATCAIGKKIPGQGYSLVGTGSLVRDFFIKNDKKVHLITSDEVISSENLSGYFLWFKKLNGRDKKKETLLSIGSEVIFKSPGLAVVPVDPQKIGRIRKHTSGLLHYRPFTLYDKEDEDARISGSYVHAVVEYKKSFDIKLYPVEQISTEIESINLSLKSLGAPIVITSDGEARVMGAITLSDMQISRVLFSQIERYRACSDKKKENGQQGNQGNEEENGAQGNQSNEEENGPQGNQSNEEENGQQGNQSNEEENGQQGNQDNEEENGPQGNQSNEEENGQPGNQDHEEENGQQGNRGNEEENGQQGNQGNEEENGQQGNQGNEEENGQQGNQGNKEENGQQGNQGNEEENGQQGNQGNEEENRQQGNQENEENCQLRNQGKEEENGQQRNQGKEEKKPTGESGQGEGELSTKESGQEGGEQPQEVQPVEREGEHDGVTFTSNYIEEAEPDTTNNSTNQYTSARVLGPSKANSPVDVIVNFASRSGERERRAEQPTDCVKFTSSYREETGKDTKYHSGNQHTSAQALCNPNGYVDVSFSNKIRGKEGIPFAKIISKIDSAKVSLKFGKNNLPPTDDQGSGGGARGNVHVEKEDNGFSASFEPGEGKELADCKLEWVENDMNVTANYRDLERQSGQDIGDQQNSNPRQSPSFGGSGENSLSFSSPGTSQDLGCSNDGSKKHGAGDHKNTREKRKYDSGNKDKNVTSSYSKEARKEDTLKHSADQNTSAQGMPQQEPTPKQAISESSVHSLAKMTPDWVYTKEEKKFTILFSDPLPCDATSYKADFEGLGEAKLKLKNPYTLVGVNPISQIPREVTVKILKFTKDNMYVTFGEDLKFTYKEEMSGPRKEVLASEKNRNAALEILCKELQSASAGSDDLNSFLLPEAGHPDKVSFTATAPSPFAFTKESTNYVRLCRLLVDVGSQVLRSIFDKIHPPASLHKVLRLHGAILKLLRRRRLLNSTQWQKLYPTHSPVSSATFDITLLTVLLRNICGLSPPVTGWDSFPPANAITIVDDIARVKYYRNSVYSHATQASMDDSSFKAYWQEIREVLVRLGGSHFGTEIDKLRYDCIDPVTEKQYHELIEQIKRDEENIKEELEKIKDSLENMRGLFERNLRDTTDKIEIETKEVKE